MCISSTVAMEILQIAKESLNNIIVYRMQNQKEGYYCKGSSWKQDNKVQVFSRPSLCDIPVQI